VESPGVGTAGSGRPTRPSRAAATPKHHQISLAERSHHGAAKVIRRDRPERDGDQGSPCLRRGKQADHYVLSHVSEQGRERIDKQFQEIEDCKELPFPILPPSTSSRMTDDRRRCCMSLVSRRQSRHIAVALAAEVATLQHHQISFCFRCAP